MVNSLRFRVNKLEHETQHKRLAIVFYGAGDDNDWGPRKIMVDGMAYEPQPGETFEDLRTRLLRERILLCDEVDVAL